MLRGIVNNGADLNFVKTHNAKDRAFGVELILPRYTRAAVYILRNPLDVAVSYARHYGQTPAEAARVDLAPRQHHLGRPHQRQAVSRQLVRSRDRLDRHAADFPVHVMRYEDMKADPEPRPSPAFSASSASRPMPTGSSGPCASPPSTR